MSGPEGAVMWKAISLSKIETGLSLMEERLETPMSASGILELDRVSAAINRLAATLLDNQARRLDLEQRLCQADRLASLGRLVASVAHELRNPWRTAMAFNSRALRETIR